MSGFTPLMVAVCNGNLDIVKTLLKSGANVNQESGVTLRSALMLASTKGDIYILNELHSFGADWSAKDG